MEVVEKCEVYCGGDDDLKFEYAKVIFRDASSNEYFYATSQATHLLVQTDIDSNQFDLKPIPLSDAWPSFTKHLTLAQDPFAPEVFIKRPSLLDCDESSEWIPDISQLLLHEVEICEMLRDRPHPNIASYIGCFVEDDKIHGICYTRYRTTLSKMLSSAFPFDRSLCLKQIRAGVRHLHDIGLIHCDINPANIFYDGDNFVIGDFDSCQKEGFQLGLKHGSPFWTDETFTHAHRENDFYGISRIEERLSRTSESE